MKKFTFQLFSDIHLENKCTFPKIHPLCDHLFLAGDIGNLTRKGNLYNFLDYCSKNWEHVYYVAGNHEFYIPDSNFTKINQSYQHTIGKRYDNVHYLDNEAVALTDDLNLYGCTFWTRPTPTDYSSFTDYMYLTKEVVTALSMEQELKLKQYLTNTTQKTLVMTHFPPLQKGTSHPRFEAQPSYMNDYFAWNTESLGTNFPWNNVLGWISGHTHHSYDFVLPMSLVVDDHAAQRPSDQTHPVAKLPSELVVEDLRSSDQNVRFVSNQVGYAKEALDGSSVFNEDGVFTVTL